MISKKIFLAIILLSTLNSCAQNKTNDEQYKNQLEKFFISNLGLITKYNESSNYSLKLLDELRKQKEFKLQTSYEAQPNKYSKINSNYKSIKKSAEILISKLEDLKKIYQLDGYNEYSYQYMSDTIFSKKKNFMNDNKDKLTEKANNLKTEIDNFFSTNKKIFKNGYQDLERHNNDKFDTTLIFNNRHGEKLDYFEYYFFNRSNIEILTTLNLFISYTKQIQVGYLNKIIAY